MNKPFNSVFHRVHLGQVNRAVTTDPGAFWYVEVMATSPPPPGGRGVQEKVIGSGLVLPPNRSFGLAFALIFAFGATAAWLNNFLPLAIVSMSASVIFGLAGLVAPGFLRPVNWTWMYIGYILGKLTGPLVTGFLFFGLISPLALFLRIIGRDELLVHSFRSASSSWKPPLGGGDTNFERQF